MPENEFEKRVQQQMEELRLQPSDEVWTQVEKELKEKKKRRVIFFLFMFAGLALLGYTSYLLTGNQTTTLAEQKHQSTAAPTATENNNTNTNIDIPADKTKPVTASPSSTAPVTKDGSNNSTQTTTAITNNQPGKSTVTSTNEVVKTDRAIKQKATSRRNTASSTVTVQKTQYEEFNADISAAENLKNKKTGKPATINEVNTEEIAVAAIQKPSLTTQQPITTTQQSATDSSSAKPEIKDSATALAGTTPEQTPPVPAKKKKNYPRIKWGVDLSGGIASSRENRFFFKSSMQPSNVYSSPSPGNSTGNPPQGLAVQPPSAVSSGLGYKAGVSVEIKFSGHSSVISGLRYSQLRENIMVGSMLGLVNLNVANQFNTYLGYRGIAQKPYRNTYHFIELPLLYQVQLNKSKKLPVLWNIGTSLSYLVSTNALVYDTTAGGVYFNDRKVFPKFHLGVQSGLYLQFGNENKVHWAIGPEISLDMTRQVKQDKFQDKKYLLYGGLTGRLYFGRLKN